MSAANLDEADSKGQLATPRSEKMLFGHNVPGGANVARRKASVVGVAGGALVLVDGGCVVDGGEAASCFPPQAPTAEPTSTAVPARKDHRPTLPPRMLTRLREEPDVTASQGAAAPVRAEPGRAGRLRLHRGRRRARAACSYTAWPA